MVNLFWNIYRGLERELLELADVIHIDERQLEVYSVKIAELLIRTCVEIESISKELYLREGGSEKTDGSDLYFDTDCLDLLETKWLLSKKVVMVSSPSLYLTNEANLTLTPLNKANKRGTSGSDWKRAYQAVKHDRARSLNKGNLKHFIRALAALFLLNIYYREEVFDLGDNVGANAFDTSMGSSVFSITLHRNFGTNSAGAYLMSSDFNKSVYLVKATDETNAELVKVLKYANEMALKKAQIKVVDELVNNNGIFTEEVLKSKLQEAYYQAKGERNPEFEAAYLEVIKTMRYEALLNKNQF